MACERIYSKTSLMNLLRSLYPLGSGDAVKYQKWIRSNLLSSDLRHQEKAVMYLCKENWEERINSSPKTHLSRFIPLSKDGSFLDSLG